MRSACGSRGSLRPVEGRLMRSLVDGIDHVYVPMVDARAAFAVLTDELELPAMWPFTSFGEFSSGGVSVGSIKLEIIEANAIAPWCTPHDPPQIQGIAFRPASPIDDAYLAEVDARSIARTAPEQYPDEAAPRWTNVYFSDLVSETSGAFVCDYHVPEPRDIAMRRRRLAERNGGRLGVLDARELVISTRDAEAARARWQRLLDPLQPTQPLKWQPAIGPAITLVPGNEERVDHLALAVRSPDVADAAWRDVSAHLTGFPLRFLAS